jgi:hypothetical protein
MSSPAEISLLAALTETDDIETLVKEGLPPECIPTEEIRPVVEWAINRYFESGRTHAPSREALVDVWGVALEDAKIDLPDESEQVDTISWAVDHLKSQYVHYTFQQWQRDAGMAMASAAPPDRLNALTEQMGTLFDIASGLQPRRQTEEFVSGFDQALADYNGRESAGLSKRGMTFEMPLIDNHTYGIHDGELAVLAAGPKTGKSFFLDALALRNAQQGRRAVLFTLENSVEMTVGRIICFALGIDGRAWQRGLLTDDEKQRMEWYREDELPKLKDRLHIISPQDSMRTPDQIYRQAQMLGADSLFVDQLTFVQHPNPRNKPRYEIVRDLMQGFKINISSGREQMPCMLAHQVNREGMKAAEKTGYLEMYMLAEGSDVERTADWVFGLYQSHLQREANQATLQVLAARREDLKSWDMDWRPASGHINAMREVEVR